MVARIERMGEGCCILFMADDREEAELLAPSRLTTYKYL